MSRRRHDHNSYGSYLLEPYLSASGIEEKENDSKNRMPLGYIASLIHQADAMADWISLIIAAAASLDDCSPNITFWL